jgi:hypothetical protein
MIVKNIALIPREQNGKEENGWRKKIVRYLDQTILKRFHP